MKKLVLIVFFVNFFSFVFSQTAVIPPGIWYRADQWVGSGENPPSAPVHAGSDPDSALLNYNRCFYFNGYTAPLLFSLSSFWPEATAMIAYQTDDTLSERGLWAFATDSVFTGISTRRIFGEKAVIRYSDTNRTDAIVNTITQSWKATDFNPGRLLIGGMDSLSYQGKLGEVVIFDHRIGGLDLLKWQSYLAVKYGITLTGRDYVSSTGDTTWHYNRHPAYAALVSGLGRDTVFGLHQKQSIMDNRLSIGTGGIAANNITNMSIINHGDFLIWGSDSTLFNLPRTTYLHNGEELLTYGHCLMEVSGATARNLSTTVQIDASKWQNTHPNTCVLLIDRNHTGDFSGNEIEIHIPVHMDTTGIVTFQDIFWDTDYSGADLFCFGFMQHDSTRTSAKSLAVSNSGNDGDFDSPAPATASYELYPNPTLDNYNLKINLPAVSGVTIRITDVQGKIIAIQSGTGQKEYHFTGSVPAQGSYLIEIESAVERKTLQLIHY